MKHAEQPPRWVDRLLDTLAPKDVCEEIKGDLYEIFQSDVTSLGHSVARRRYIFNSVGFLAKAFFWKRSANSSTSNIMIASYFKMASRSLVAHRGTAGINIAGLVIGMASALVIFSIIQYEISFDSFHSDRDQIFRVVRVSGDDMSEFRTGVSYPVPAAIKENIPGIDRMTTMIYYGGANIAVLNAEGTVMRKFNEESGVAMLEPTFFNVFDFKDKPIRWIAGNAAQSLRDPFSVVITQAMARKYFGDEDPMGKLLQFQRTISCKVTGVVEDFPVNTDFPFSIMVSYSTSAELMKERANDWTSVDDSHQTYIVLPSGYTQKTMEEALAKLHASYVSKELAAMRHYLLQPLDELHFDTRFGNYNGRTISKQTLLTLTLVAVFLLLVASINYVNLATAQSTLRSKEIGLRKVMGSNRTGLIQQFLLETFVVVLLSAIIAVGVAELALWYLQSLLGIEWNYELLMAPPSMLAFAAMVLLITLFAGLYPSVMISKFNPVAALKNRFATERIGGMSLRKTLVVVQFTITQIFVAGTFIVVSQMRYFREADMGFNRDAIVNIQLPDFEGATDVNGLAVLAQQLRANPIVAEVSYSYTLPSGVNRRRSYQNIGPANAAATKDYAVFEYSSIDSAYLRLYGIKLRAGRNLDDHDTIGNVIINETLAKNLLFADPEDAIGAELKRGGGEKVTVVGIIEDYYSNSLKEGVDNLMVETNNFNYVVLSVKLDLSRRETSLQAAVTELQTIWHANYPQHLFNYQFFDENIRAFYSQEEKYATLFQWFTVIFLLIGCLGLYGLITFVVNRRGKEVAVRKVLGASASHILAMFSREYVQLIVLSFFIAVPIAYWGMDQWLSGFKNHITLQLWLFCVPGMLVLLVAIAVVGIKSLSAAHANPVQKLRED